MEHDLGAVVQKEGSRIINAEFPETMPDADTFYQQAISNLRKRNAPPEPKLQVKGNQAVSLNKKRTKPPNVSTAEKEQAAKDYYANVRTNVSESTILLISSRLSYVGFARMDDFECKLGILSQWIAVRLTIVGQVLLIVLILKGAEPSGTFDKGASVDRTKGYLIFILVFTTLSNLIVSLFAESNLGCVFIICPCHSDSADLLCISWSG